MFDLAMTDDEKNTFIAGLALGYMCGITDIDEAVHFTAKVLSKDTEEFGKERAAVLEITFRKFKELGS